MIRPASDKKGKSAGATVDAYIAKAPADQQAALQELRAMIRAALPQAAETIGSSGFPVYTIDGQWVAGFATRKKSPMFYMMVHSVMQRYEAQLGRLVTGKSCVEYRVTAAIRMEELRMMVVEMLRDAGSQHRANGSTLQD